MKRGQAKKRAPKTGKRARATQPGGVYAGLLGATAQARLAAHGSLDDELALLRVQVYHLTLTIDLEEEDGALKKLRLLAQMIRTIAMLERVRALSRSEAAFSEATLPQVMAAASPHKDL